MTQTEINQVVEAMELRPEYKNILRKCLNGDTEEIKKAIEELNAANTEVNTKLNELVDKVNNIQSDVFAIVDELPTENIKNKIYCVKDTTGGGTNNKYIEYIYVETTKSWEKVGEFKADPDLSNYAKLSGAQFNGKVIFNNIPTTHQLMGRVYIEYPSVRVGIKSDNSPNNHTVFGTENNYLDIGESEDFIFTLEDGTTITKSIRVISTTNQTE